MRKVNYKHAVYVENSHAMNVQLGHRSLATARKANNQWLLTAKGFCWIDETARKPNIFGFVEPSFMTVNNKVTARHKLQQIALMA